MSSDSSCCIEDDDHVCVHVCDYCGVICNGYCEDPDTCRCCWYSQHVGNIYDNEEDLYGQCVTDRCRCKCHVDFYKNIGIRFEGGVMFYDGSDSPPYERKGTFPFLALAVEIREKIYSYAMLQDGKHRSCANHRGAIHTALLHTCRQVYSEARHVPLTINRLCFSSPLDAYDFFGFTLAPSVRQLVTRLDVECYMREFPTNIWTLLLRQLAKMSITHLRLTLTGRYLKWAISGHTCLTNRYSLLTGLKSFDLVIASYLIQDEEKKQFQEEARTNWIKGYIREPLAESSSNASTSKRTATSDDEDMAPKPAKKTKRESNKTESKQTSENSLRSGLRSHSPTTREVQEGCDRPKTALILQYERLMQYATALDTEASPVKIRLQGAREAAEASNEADFKHLASGIWTTLEEHYVKITAARMNVARSSAPLGDAENVDATPVVGKEEI